MRSKKNSRKKGNEKRHYLQLFAYQNTSIKIFIRKILNVLGRLLYPYWIEVLLGGGLSAELALCRYPHRGWAPCPIRGAIVSSFLKLPTRCTVSVCDLNKLTMTSLLLKSLASLSCCLLGCLGCCRPWDEFSIHLLKTVCCNLGYVDTEKATLIYT